MVRRHTGSETSQLGPLDVPKELGGIDLLVRAVESDDCHAPRHTHYSRRLRQRQIEFRRFASTTVQSGNPEVDVNEIIVRA